MKILLSLMSKIFKFFLIIIGIVFLLQSCGLLVVSLEYFHQAGEGEKDVSANFERGHVIGKEYELMKDAFLNQIRDSNRVRLDRSLISSYTSDKNGSEIKFNIYLFSIIIPRGTKFRVCEVHVRTSFGSELCSQYILATLLDKRGNPLSTKDFYGNPTLVYVTDLFENTYEMPNKNWIFIPRQGLIKEITN